MIDRLQNTFNLNELGEPIRSWRRSEIIPRLAVGIAALAVSLSACVEDNMDLDAVAETYVRFVLAVGEHDPDFVDAYYGPEAWKNEVGEEALPPDEIKASADSLIGEIERNLTNYRGADKSRAENLLKQIGAVSARAAMLSGVELSFDDESAALYDAVAPSYPLERFQAVVDSLDLLLPGAGAIHERFDAFRSDFVIPEDRLSTVFEAAISACRERTVQYIDLPEQESFTVEYVTDKPWSGYNWYQGDFRSVIQVNTDLPIYIDRAIDLACHEGYPGHHVYNVLLERHLMRDRGWIEYAIYPLFSPQSLIAEGSANYGIHVAFPEAERLEYEGGTLFGLAGIDPASAPEYYEVMGLMNSLDYAGNEAAREYLDGRIDRDTAVSWLVRYAMMPAPRAEQRISFIERYRSYVINYNLGQDLVKNFVEAGLSQGDRDRRWERFRDLLSSPRVPSALARGFGS